MNYSYPESDWMCLFLKDLVDDLKEELGGHFEEVVVSLMTPLGDFIGQSVVEAFKVRPLLSIENKQNQLLSLHFINKTNIL